MSVPSLDDLGTALRLKDARLVNFIVHALRPRLDEARASELLRQIRRDSADGAFLSAQAALKRLRAAAN